MLRSSGTEANQAEFRVEKGECSCNSQEYSTVQPSSLLLLNKERNIHEVKAWILCMIHVLEEMEGKQKVRGKHAVCCGADNKNRAQWERKKGRLQGHVQSVYDGNEKNRIEKIITKMDKCQDDEIIKC